ncbi:hypothetical protein [Kitasatospora sp. NPDC059327]|uniref:hypothetical protein n=1 Tax=Kitasatospora sp. NPDC059327 TaxID=3346803 RepID=UPI00367A6E81
MTGFLEAAALGSPPRLEAVLADQLTAWSDGGGKVRAALRPVRGRDTVARLVLGL